MNNYRRITTQERIHKNQQYQKLSTEAINNNKITKDKITFSILRLPFQNLEFKSYTTLTILLIKLAI